MADALKAFRRNAVHVRQALALFDVAKGSRVDPTSARDEDQIERYKRLAIPMRRVFNSADRASFSQALAAAREASTSETALAAIAQEWDALHRELETSVGLGGGKVLRRQLLSEWMDGAAFYDRLDRDRAYDHVIDQYGKAADGIGETLLRDAARIVLRLDEVAAAILGEPVILPPPPRTPPPPKDPDVPWWKRLFQ